MLGAFLDLKEMPRPDQVNSQECIALCKNECGQRKRARLVAVAGVKGSVKPASRQAWVLISVGGQCDAIVASFLCVRLQLGLHQSSAGSLRNRYSAPWFGGARAKIAIRSCGA